LLIVDEHHLRLVLTEYLGHHTTAVAPCFAANIVLVAMRDIAEGGELTTGYARPGGL
jgi:hypothetical protein